MTKKEFLDILRESLAGNVPAAVIEENIRYYKDYIENNGVSEEKTLEDLGDPHLIARTVIDSFKASKGPMADFYTEQARNEYSQGAYEENEENSNYNNYGSGQYDPGMMHRQFKWYEKLIAVLVVIGVIALFLLIGGLAAYIVVRVVVPILFLFLILKIIRNFFGRG